MADNTTEGKKTLPPKKPTALKRQLQNEKKRLRNRMFKSTVRTATRAFNSSLKESNAELITEKLNALYSLYDKGVKRGIYSKNKAARSKSRLTLKVAKQS